MSKLSGASLISESEMETLFVVAMGLELLGQTSGNTEKKMVQMLFVALFCLLFICSCK